MEWSALALVAVFAVIAGLDRTALLQVMISRPIVCAPLASWVLGDPLQGLQVGAMLELLWLARLPVGATVPPDDTQVALGATVLASIPWSGGALGSAGVVVLALLVTMPLGKIGQLADNWARERNARLLERVERDVEGGVPPGVERWHLYGLAHFALASLVSFLVIVGIGALLMHLLAPLLGGVLALADMRVRLVFPLVGAAVILASLNVRRALTLFVASFSMVTMLLWLS